MNLENIGGWSFTTIVIVCAGWLVKIWLESKIKADVEQQYKKELAEFQNGLEKAKDTELAKLQSELSEKKTLYGKSDKP